MDHGPGEGVQVPIGEGAQAGPASPSSSNQAGPASPGSTKRRAKFAVGGGVVVLAVGALIVWAITRPGATSFYMTVSEVTAAGPGATGSSYRVNGNVVPGSLSRDGIETTFDIADDHNDLTVVTDDALPDAFWMAYGNNASTIDIVAQGHLQGSKFVASKVLAKCPSKFKTQT